MKIDREEFEHKRLERMMSGYDKKYKPRRFAEVLIKGRAEMVRRYGEYARTAARVSQVVYAVTDNPGIPGIRRVRYRTFGLEIEKLCRLHPGRDISDELKVLRYKWSVRGLDPYLLDKVEAVVLTELRRRDKESGLTNGSASIQ